MELIMDKLLVALVMMLVIFVVDAFAPKDAVWEARKGAQIAAEDFLKVCHVTLEPSTLTM